MENYYYSLMEAIERIFSNWTALKLVSEHNGVTTDRIYEFSGYIAELILSNDDIYSSELSNELEDYVNDQFNMVLQDNSAAEVAEQLTMFHRRCHEGTQYLISTELRMLPPLQPWIKRYEAPTRLRTQRVPVNNDDSASGSKEGNSMDVAGDEWIEVGRKKRQ